MSADVMSKMKLMDELRHHTPMADDLDDDDLAEKGRRPPPRLDWAELRSMLADVFGFQEVSLRKYDHISKEDLLKVRHATVRHPSGIMGSLEPQPRSAHCLQRHIVLISADVS